MKPDYKILPSVSEVIVNIDNYKSFNSKYLTSLIRSEIKSFRKKIESGKINYTRIELTEKIAENVIRTLNGNIIPLINGTGIVLHTGFGRAPISKKVLSRVVDKLSSYINLEFQLEDGKRGDRNSLVDTFLAAVSCSESALVVNNNAAAVMLTINTLADQKEVVVSRGQLVEIGGSFRIPDIISKSSGILKEVGSTNRTHLKDYEKAISKNTGMILWVHTSNYKVEGFTKDVSLEDLVSLGKKYKIPVVADLGSGILVEPTFNIGTELTVESVVKTGASLVTYSGDKLLGGPQSGIIAGKAKFIKELKKNSIYRALRCDKFTLALLEETLMTYNSEGINKSNMSHLLLNRTQKELYKTADKINQVLNPKTIKKLGLKIVPSLVEAGSGAMPVQSLESVAFTFTPKDITASKLATNFRAHRPSIVGYIKGNKFYLDLKALIPGQEKILISGIEKVAESL